MLEVVAVAVVAFVVTNVDDLVVLTAFCGHERYRLGEILAGQYLGFGTLVAVSLVGGATLAALADDHVRWLGVLPIAVGVLWYVRTRETGPTTEDLPAVSSPRSRIGLVAGIGITDGADNVSVYVPLFAASGTAETWATVGVFLVVAGGWVLFARWLAGRPVLARRLEDDADAVIPIVLVGLGVAILAGFP